MILDNKTILITGGTGSLGKVLVQRILTGELGTPKKVIIFSRDETKQHDMRIFYLSKKSTTDETICPNFMTILDFRIGDIRSYADVCSAIKDVDMIINAAALKQVPSCEYFPTQALLTNCIGADNIIRAIRNNDYPVDTVIGISTDKAVKPINVMGITKALQERIFISANILNPQTRFICVRYGNVLVSRGSVIPLFHEQIKSGGPVTLTTCEMTRFLLSLNQAVDIVFEALQSAKPGEIYVPNVPSARIVDIAKALIGHYDIKIRTTGIRPGEKVHEILISAEESEHCIKRKNYYIIRPTLPELAGNVLTTENPFSNELSSADNLLNFTDLVKLLTEHNLMAKSL